MFFVYELVDPRTNSIGYVGITDDPNERYSQHILVKGTNGRKDAWIDQLLQEGVRPQMKIVEIVEDEQEARKREGELIRRYLEQNIPITNIKLEAHRTKPDPFSKSRKYRVKEVRSIEQYKQEYGACGAKELATMFGIEVEELIRLAHACRVFPKLKGWEIETRDIVYKTTDEELFDSSDISTLKKKLPLLRKNT